MKDIIFLIVLFIANVIQAITGFAGTVLAMPASMFLLGVDNAKVVLNVIALLSGLLIAISSYKRINKKTAENLCFYAHRYGSWNIIMQSYFIKFIAYYLWNNHYCYCWKKSVIS